MTYREFLRMIAATVFAKGCGTCGGGGWVGGAKGHPCSACSGGGKSATESRGR